MKWRTGKGQSSFCGATFFGCDMGIDEILAIKPKGKFSTVKEQLFDMVWNRGNALYGPFEREQFAVATFSVYNSLEVVFYNYAEYLKGKTAKGLDSIENERAEQELDKRM